MSDISATITAKSDQLNAADLIGGGVEFTVINTVVNTKSDQPVSITLSGGAQPYKPCLSMRRVLAKLWGLESDHYKGKRMVLFCDPETMWKGQKVGGIRISAMSHIGTNQEVTVPASKHKVVKYKISALPDAVQSTGEITVTFVCDEIAKANNQDELALAANLANSLNDHDKQIARDEYKSRLNELK